MRETTEITENFRGKGLRITPQRIAILQAVKDLSCHPTVEEVFSIVRKDFSTISLTTVYRTLDKLVTLGELSQINYLGNKTRFDHRLDTHHHVICSKCGNIKEIEIARSCAEACIPQDVREKIKVTGYSVVFYGNCVKCNSKQM